MASSTFAVLMWLRGLVTATFGKLQGKVAVLAPKAEALDRLANAAGSLSLRGAAKVCKMAPGEFNTYLMRIGWLYRGDRGTLSGFQTKINQGLIEHRLARVLQDNGKDLVASKARIP